MDDEDGLTCQKCEERPAEADSELCEDCSRKGWGWWYDEDPQEEEDD